MKWTECAIQDLKKYKGLKESIVNIGERIEALEIKFTGLKGQRITAMPTGDSVGALDDFLLDNIVERERLKMLLEANTKLLNIIDRGLEALSENDRLIIEHFYIDRRANHAVELMKRLNVEQSQVYRMKDRALYRFTTSMYGIGEY